MAKVKKTKVADEVENKNPDFRIRLARIIEITLDSLGVVARVAEVNNRPQDIEFCLEVALGTPLESITKLNKDIAMALASPTGDVEIVAPIPGRSLIAIRVPTPKGWIEVQSKHSEESLEISPKEVETQEEPPEPIITLRDYIAAVFYIVAAIFEITVTYLRKLGNYIKGRDIQF